MAHTARKSRKCGVCGVAGHNRRTCTSTRPVSNVVRLADRRGFHTRSRIGEAPPNIRRPRLRDIRPSNLSAVEADLRQGNFERWADLRETMLQTDPHLAGVWETRLVGVASAESEIVPGDDSPEGEMAGELVREAVDRMPSWTGFLGDMLQANGDGLAVSELVWASAPFADRIAWFPRPEPVQTRDLRFTRDWSIEVRSYTDTGSYEWRRIPAPGSEPQDHDLDPAGFVIHRGHRAGSTPNFSGDLLTVTHYWLFKHWAEVYSAQAQERNGFPVPYAIVEQGATDDAFDDLLDDLSRLTAGKAAVFREGVREIQFLQASSENAEAMNAYIDRLNREMTKGVLGSTDNVESGEGSYARAVSQAGVTIYPRHYVDAEELRQTLKRQLIRPLLSYNLGLFGGRMPPVPDLAFRLVSETPAEIPEHLLLAGMSVTDNEARASAGLEPVDEEGERRLVMPTGGTTPTSPFSRQPSLPLTTLPRRASSASALAAARGRYGSSVTREPTLRPRLRTSRSTSTGTAPSS